MTKEPLPKDVMSMLIQLVRKGPDAPDDIHDLPMSRRAHREAHRARFHAAFSVCAGMAKDHPDLALHWLEALKFDQSWRRVKQINALSANIVGRLAAERQPPLF